LVRTGVGFIDTVVIGAGHAGLAMSYCLTRRGIEHVVLERGEIANSWKRERWDSLRLLTPNFHSRLPGFDYFVDRVGVDPDGFMTLPDVIGFIESYAAYAAAPVHTSTTVTSVCRAGNGYRVITDRGEWRCRAVVLASGACNLPAIPALANEVPDSVATITAAEYRNPSLLAEGGVLVVGASATGVQLAEEIHRSGRAVTLSIGEHVRMPRRYRGRDIHWWMDAAGLLDERFDTSDDITRARNVPSAQLAGSVARSTLDLNRLRDAGVRCVGRMAGLVNGHVQFSGALRNHCAMADLKLGRLLDRFDSWATQNGIAGVIGAAERLEPTRVDDNPALSIDLKRGEIRTIVWATGYRPDYRWLDVPVLDRKGRLRHEGGVVAAPGMYVLGLPFMRRRKSSFIHGVGDDARDLSEHLEEYLGGCEERSISLAAESR
jgi:putative flavoprotein involved in K+ transport